MRWKTGSWAAPGQSIASLSFSRPHAARPGVVADSEEGLSVANGTLIGVGDQAHHSSPRLVELIGEGEVGIPADDRSARDEQRRQDR